MKTLNHRIQFSFLSLYLILQTLGLRFVYLNYGRPAYKVSAYLGFTVLIFLILILTICNKWRLKDLGIRVDNIKKNLGQYFLVTLFFGLAIFVAKIILQRPTFSILKHPSHFLGLFLLSSFGQEFVFRGFLVKLQREIFNDKKYIILINAMLFGFMHTMVITEPILFSFFSTFLLGLSLAYLYLKNPNLIQVTISHSILNFLVALLGFFSYRV